MVKGLCWKGCSWEEGFWAVIQVVVPMHTCAGSTGCSQGESLESSKTWLLVLLWCACTICILWFRCILLMREVAKLFLVLLPSSWLCFLAPVCWSVESFPISHPHWPCAAHVDTLTLLHSAVAWLHDCEMQHEGGLPKERDCPFWCLSDLDKRKHSSLCLGLWLRYNPLLCASLWQGRAFSNQVGSQMRRGGLPVVYQKR